jgi:hypothetical protein
MLGSIYTPKRGGVNRRIKNICIPYKTFLQTDEATPRLSPGTDD